MADLNLEEVNERMEEGYTLYRQGMKRDAAEVWFAVWHLIQEELKKSDILYWEDLLNDRSEEERLRRWLQDLMRTLKEVDEDAEFMRKRKEFTASYSENTRNQVQVEKSDSSKSQPLTRDAMQQELARQMNTMPLKENDAKQKDEK